jgi:hypothetical protein
MDTELYKQTLANAKVEMAQLLQERRITEERISKLAPVIEYLSALCDELPSLPPDLPQPSAGDIGLSDAIRLAFKAAAPNPLSPTDVRDKLKQSGFHMDRYKYELPPIHNTINRLRANGEIEDFDKSDGEKAFRWVSSLKRILAEVDSPRIGSKWISRARDSKWTANKQKDK